MTPALRDALAEVSGWGQGRVRVIETLGGGHTSECFLVEHRDDRYVLRLDTPLAATLGLDRTREVTALSRAAAAGLAPRVLYADPARGLLVTRYLEGRVWSDADLHDPRQLRRLGELLRRLHEVPPPSQRLDLAATAGAYARALDTEPARRWATQAADLVGSISGRAPVLCHNDAIAQNIVDGAGLMLIDWEYAGAGEPLFELAIIVRHNDLGTDLAAVLLDACLGTSDDQTMHELSQYCRVSDRLIALWLTLVRRHAGLSVAQETQLQRTLERMAADDGKSI